MKWKLCPKKYNFLNNNKNNINNDNKKGLKNRMEMIEETVCEVKVFQWKLSNLKNREKKKVNK